MKKWIQIGIMSVLGIGLVVTVVMLVGANGDLTSAEATIDDQETTISGMENNIVVLEADLSAAEALAADLDTQLAVSKDQCENLTCCVDDLTAQNDSLGTQLSSTKSSLSSEKSKTAALTEDLETVKDPRHFSSVSELADWLQQDDTDEVYEDLRADNYLQMSFILQVRAARDGYILPAYVIPFENGVTWTSNIACIGDTFYLVEAGDDSVEEYYTHWEAVPSHPEPLD